MPIDIDKFEEGKEPDSAKGSTVKPAVEKLLAENQDQAYTVREIAEEIDANKATVNHTCRKLHEDGKVERRQVGGLIYHRWVAPEEEEEQDT